MPNHCSLVFFFIFLLFCLFFFSLEYTNQCLVHLHAIFIAHTDFDKLSRNQSTVSLLFIMSSYGTLCKFNVQRIEQNFETRLKFLSSCPRQRHLPIADILCLYLILFIFLSLSLSFTSPPPPPLILFLLICCHF